MEYLAFLIAIPLCLVRVGFTVTQNRGLASFGLWLLGAALLLVPFTAQLESKVETKQLKALLEMYRTFNGTCKAFVGGPTEGRFREVPCTIDQVEKLANFGSRLNFDGVFLPLEYFFFQLTAFTTLFLLAGSLLSRFTATNGTSA